MAGDDLTSIPGLLDRHRRVLESRLQIATYDALVRADPKAILAAMSRIRSPRPTLAEIRGWQEQALHRQGAAGLGEAPGWSRAASFVLSFEHRQVNGQLERRLVAQQTELEPEQEQPPSSWPGGTAPASAIGCSRGLGGANAKNLKPPAWALNLRR